MNYMTGEYAVCLFPRTTLAYHNTVACQAVVSHDASGHPVDPPAWIEKYQRRGFNVCTMNSAPTVPQSRRELSKMDRTVGDKLTWVLPLDRNGMCRISVPSPVEPITDAPFFRRPECPAETVCDAHVRV